MKLICYFVIITRSKIIKITFELTRYFINLDSKYLKAADHCIKYLHATKFLTIRYSNLKNEEFNNQISNLNVKMSLTSNSKLNKKTLLNKKNNDKQIFKKTTNASFANNLDRKNVKEYIFKLFDDMID
jgi:2-methylcitrate dehydratase PrpD